MALVSLAEAASRLGVSVDTVRRRLQKGELRGQQQARAQGYVWLIEIEEEPDPGNSPADAEHISQISVAACQAEIGRLEGMVAMLQDRVNSQETELEARRREVQELHVLLQQSQAALPASREGRSWWRRFWIRD
jgi:predicted ArsR family transcriptional regulator